MKLEPETFFIGITDFFSVMLPGAVVTYLAKSPVGWPQFTCWFPTTCQAEGWAVFLLCSYLMGHFIFLIGSKLDKICDMIRHATESAEDKLALGEVLEIKQKYVPDVDGKAVINAFQWAKARLTIECPAALVEVQRFEADSKFFRSLVVVLVPLVVWLPRKARSDREYWLLLLLCLLFCVLSCLRYAERRFKANK